MVVRSTCVYSVRGDPRASPRGVQARPTREAKRRMDGRDERMKGRLPEAWGLGLLPEPTPPLLRHSLAPTPVAGVEGGTGMLGGEPASPP